MGVSSFASLREVYGGLEEGDTLFGVKRKWDLWGGKRKVPIFMGGFALRLAWMKGKGKLFPGSRRVREGKANDGRGGGSSGVRFCQSIHKQRKGKRVIQNGEKYSPQQQEGVCRSGRRVRVAHD